MKEEKWVYINNSNGLYMVSNMGRVMSQNLIKGRIMSPSIAPNGYVGISLVVEPCKPIRHTVHGLVAIHFVCGRTDDRSEVNHIDGNKLNNKAENLEWCTRQENMEHHRLTKCYGKDFHVKMENDLHRRWERYSNNLKSWRAGSDRMKTSFNPRSKPVVHLQTGIFYDSLSEAYRSYSINSGYQTIYQRTVKGKSVFRYI